MEDAQQTAHSISRIREMGVRRWEEANTLSPDVPWFIIINQQQTSASALSEPCGLLCSIVRVRVEGSPVSLAWTPRQSRPQRCSRLIVIIDTASERSATCVVKEIKWQDDI